MSTDHRVVRVRHGRGDHPVGTVRHAGGGFTVGDGEPGPVTTRLRARLTGIQEGREADPYEWMRRFS